MTPDELGARLSSLREAGEKLRERPARETLDALARVLDGWSAPDSAWQRALAPAHAAACGFAPAMVSEGLREALAGFTGEALRALVASELGGIDALDEAGPRMVSGFPTTSLLLAGSLPMPTLLALIAPLVLRSPVLARAGSRDPVSAAHVARSIAEVDTDLGRCVDVVAFDHAESGCVDALLAADCVVLTGSDATLADLAGRVLPPRRCVTYGHRTSIAVVGGDALRSRRAEVAAQVARDVALWDQLGCLSPIAVYALAAPAAVVDAFAEALAEALAGAEQRWPRGPIDAASAAAFAHERDEAMLRAAAGRRIAVHGDPGSAWAVVREDGAALRPAPLHRFVRVLPVRDEAELLAALRPLGPHLAGAALAGFGGRSGRVARALADLGASRIWPLGALQRPPLAWSRDNRGVLAPLARFAELESGPGAPRAGAVATL